MGHPPVCLQDRVADPGFWSDADLAFKQKRRSGPGQISASEKSYPDPKFKIVCLSSREI